ncbi:MAG TPA: GtrA family protein [Acidimicrobiales bacterium]|nr:GtrA family protein [Acidimicrobiales bacterium]
MGMTAIARLTDLGRAHGPRAIKYASVSVVGVVVTQVLLVITYQGGMSAAWANFVSVSGASIPAYLLNRQWVWGKTGRHSLQREVLPFWGMSLLGLIVSTVAVGYVARHWDSQLAVSATNIASFGTLWVAKYLLLDQVMFGSPSALGTAADPADVDAPA